MERGIGTEKGEGFCRQPAEDVCPDGGAGGGVPASPPSPAGKERASGSRGLGSRRFGGVIPLEP